MPARPLPAPIPLHRPWPQRWLAQLTEALAEARHRRAARRERHGARGQDACGLSARTLADMAAPDEWLYAAERCRARRDFERALLLRGIAPGVPW